MEFKLNEQHRNIPDEELLDDVKRVAKIYGKNTLTRDEYKKYGKYGLNTFRRRFGSWNSMLKMIGLTTSERQEAAALAGHNYAQLNDEQLIDDLRRVSVLLGTMSFTSAEYKKYGEYSRDSYFKRFGTWNNALVSAGLEPFEKVRGKRIDDTDLLEEIGRVWVMLGRQPTSIDLKNGVSKYSLHAYASHFGSWRKALEAFIHYVNNNEFEATGATEEQDSSRKNMRQVVIEPTIKWKKHITLREPNLRMRFLVMQRDNFKCCICGASPAKDPSVELHIDHIIPWSKGGETTMDNLQTLCSKCNLGKSDLM